MSAQRKLEEREPTLKLVADAKRSSSLTGVAVDPTLGRVLNLNLLGNSEKICSYNCAYCSMGPTTVRLNQAKKGSHFPLLSDIVGELREFMASSNGSQPDFDVLCVTGNGEPTLHPDFPDIARALLELRIEGVLTQKIAIRTNGSSLDSRKILEAVNLFDERVVKLDVGNDRLFKLFNRPLTRKSLSRMITDLRSLKDVIIEAIFSKGIIDNTEVEDVDDWIEVIAMTKAKHVYLSTIRSRVPPPGVEPCDEDTLYTIASRLERRTQIRTTVTNISTTSGAVTDPG